MMKYFLLQQSQQGRNAWCNYLKQAGNGNCFWSCLVGAPGKVGDTGCPSTLRLPRVYLHGDFSLSPLGGTHDVYLQRGLCPI